MSLKPVIDESAIPRPESVDITRWEPPRHVYFGPKDPNTGRMKPEPKYVYTPYPRCMYARNGAGLKTVHVNSAAEEAELGPDWKHSPEDFGFTTHPTREQLREQEQAEFEAEAEAMQTTSTLEPMRKKPGRPRKEAA